MTTVEAIVIDSLVRRGYSPTEAAKFINVLKKSETKAKVCAKYAKADSVITNNINVYT